MMNAVLSNPGHPEYGVATIPFPIPHDQYAYCMELLEALEIGDAVKADCKVEKINSFYDVLRRTEMLTVNVEELNYLAKRLDSFDTGEAAQFQAMAHKLELFELKDLINLTFSCQEATVISDFSDLVAVGRDHYMNLHGGCAKTEELDALDGEATARMLIASGSGTVTPYGVVYDNGMQLKQIYDGQFFPCYYYEPNAITVAVTSKSEPEDTEHITWLYLPMVQEEIDRALQRAGITDPADARLRLEDSQLPNEVDVLLDMEQKCLTDLNALAQATDGFSGDSLKKLGAVVDMAKPQNAAQIKNLAENLDLFDFTSGAHTPEPRRDECRDEMLRLTLHVKGKPDYALVLPADEEYLTDVKKYLGIDDFTQAQIRDVRFKVPYIGEMAHAMDCHSVEGYNEFAEELEGIWQKDGALLTYAAVLSVEKPDTLQQARELLKNLNKYERIVEGTYGYGQQRLQEKLGLDDEGIEKLEGYMDFERYGLDCMEQDGVVETEFGLLRRLNPPFPEQRQGLQMKGF